MESHASERAEGASPNAQSQLLRAHVEREVRSPAIVLVTSARAGDGKSVTAFALATSLALAGHRTALVTSSAALADPTADGPDVHPFPLAAAGRFREVTTEFLASSRLAYDYTIVDTAPLLADRLALALLGGVEGVLVTVRVGRAPTDDDESTMRIIERSGGRVIGVVAATPDAIDDFNHRGAVVAPHPDRATRRPVPPGGVPAMRSLQSLVVVGMMLVLAGSLQAFMHRKSAPPQQNRTPGVAYAGNGNVSARSASHRT